MFSRVLKRGISSFKTGQPIYETRPHLIKSGQLTPFITATEYFQRRVRLSADLQPNTLTIIPSNIVKHASGSVFYQFQQNTDFFYLTGWNEPDSICLMEKPNEDPASIIFHLIVPPKDPAIELWDGERTGQDGAINIFNADEAHSNKDSLPILTSLLKKYKTVYYDIKDPTEPARTSIFNRLFPAASEPNPHRQTIDAILRENNNIIKPLSNHISPLRAIKSTSELRAMHLASRISAKAYNSAFSTHIRSEKGLHSFLNHNFKLRGCEDEAYIPVVAGGPNALSIHYTRNDNLLKDGEMVLVDAAGKLGGYCSDISRTWPVNGKFTNAQKDLYEAVLNVNKECIKLCKASLGYSLNDIHNQSVKLMTRELRNAGFTGLMDWQVSKYLYPHYIGHNLGLDVHDVPQYSRYSEINQGQVITIEPGVYVPEEGGSWPKEFRGIGIRIEDDVAVGKDNYVVLTSDAKKEVKDIEALGEKMVDLGDEVLNVFEEL